MQTLTVRPQMGKVWFLSWRSSREVARCVHCMVSATQPLAWEIQRGFLGGSLDAGWLVRVSQATVFHPSTFHPSRSQKCDTQ